jgi:hypothetical protein
MTSVIHVMQAPKGFQDNPDFVYIGRRNAKYGLQASPFANPFHIGRDGTREEVIEKYHAYIEDRLAREPELGAKLDALRGKTLVCWCAPKACHADVLVQLMNASAGDS